MIRKFGGLFLLVIILLATSGCTRYVSSSAQGQQTGFILLDSQTKIGQTFTARFNGLAGVGFVLKPEKTSTPNQAGVIILHLRSDPQSSQDLRTASLPVQNVDRVGSYRFFFQPVPDSNQQDYYLLLEMVSAGEVGVGSAGSETYLDGAVYINGIADDGQLSFNLKYDPSSLYIGLIKETPAWLLWILISLVIFVIPGWALLSLTWSGWRKLDLWEKFSLGSGASLAIYPVLFLWTNLVGLNLGALYAWLPSILGILVILWRNFSAINQRVFLRSKNHSTPAGDISAGPASEKLVSQENLDPPDDVGFTAGSPPSRLPAAEKFEKLAATTVAIFLIGAIIFSRIWVIRSLDFPLWGDSYQHTMISQLMLDNRGLFQSWLPYAELSTFTYHFGFHTLVACFDWISRLPIQKAILWVGQVINILVIICLYPLVKKLGKNHWSGVFLLLIAGLVSPMPMSYLNWGRYTQLAGQAILPAAVFCIWHQFQSERLNRLELVATWIIVGGLALTHYRVLIFVLLFVVAVILLNLRAQPRRVLIRKTFWICIGGAILFLPWLIMISPHDIAHNFIEQITTLPSQASSFLTEYNTLGNPFDFFPPILWFSLPVIMGWAFWRREIEFITIFVWWYLVFLASNPQMFGLPGAGVLSNFAIQIAFYIPFGIIIGAALARLSGGLVAQTIQTEKFSSKIKSILLITETVAILVFVAAISISQIGQRLDDIKPVSQALMTRPDARAMDWIRQNTNPEDRFLVNSFFAYGGSIIAGSDGGWWIPLLAGRLSTQPPLNYGTEEGLVRDNELLVNQILKEIIENGITHPQTMEMLKNRGIDYVYIGQQQGHVNSPKPLIDNVVLQTDPHFQLVYHRDHVWIYKINY